MKKTLQGKYVEYVLDNSKGPAVVTVEDGTNTIAGWIKTGDYLKGKLMKYKFLIVKV